MYCLYYFRCYYKKRSNSSTLNEKRLLKHTSKMDEVHASFDNILQNDIKVKSNILYNTNNTQL